MKDKIVLITGGNDGIGKATAIGLAKAGATVVIASRNPQKGAQAVEAIRQASGNFRIALLELDLSSLKSVKNAAESFKKTYPRLDVLVNNAGTLTSEEKFTAEGFEMMFGVNHLGHFYLTLLLLEHLKKSPAARIVNVSSEVYYGGNIDFDNLKGEKNAFDTIKGYSRSKLANVLFTRGLAKRYPDISSNALHPGVVATDFGNKHTVWYFGWVWRLMTLFLITPQKGARTSIFLATDPSIATVSGQFFDDHQRQRTLSKNAANDELVERLWELSAAAVKDFEQNLSQI